MAHLPTLTRSEIDRLAETANLLDREITEKIAQIMGPDSAAQKVLDALDEYEPKGFKGHILEDGEKFVVLWEAVSLPDEEGE